MIKEKISIIDLQYDKNLFLINYLRNIMKESISLGQVKFKKSFL